MAGDQPPISMNPTASLKPLPAARYPQDLIDQLRDLVLLDNARSRRAARPRRFHQAELRQDAPQHGVHRRPFLDLRPGLRLPARAKVEAAQLGPRPEAVRELEGIEHRVEQFENAILQGHGGLERPAARQLVELPRKFRNDIAGCVVPPLQPATSIGTNTASQPDRNTKSGRMGRTAAIIRIMNPTSPVESLTPMIRGHSASRFSVGTSIGLANFGMLYSVTSIGVRAPISRKYARTDSGHNRK